MIAYTAFSLPKPSGWSIGFGRHGYQRHLTQATSMGQQAASFFHNLCFEQPIRKFKAKLSESEVGANHHVATDAARWHGAQVSKPGPVCSVYSSRTPGQSKSVLPG